MIWKFLNICEDSCTASVLGHLSHLPAETVWCILRGACFTTSLPRSPGDLVSVTFWPSWNPEGTGNSNRVVPDALLRFEEVDLIIEAKRRDTEQQDRSQWEAEFQAYLNEYGMERASVRMIALGGIWTEADSAVSGQSPDPKIGLVECPVHMCTWRGLLVECRRMQRELLSNSTATHQATAHKRILTDVMHVLACHGFSVGLWFEDFKFEQHRLGCAADLARQALRAAQKTFSTS